MKRATISVALHIHAPILTRSSSIGLPGVDAVMARRAYPDAASGKLHERYYIPGSLLKGLVREAWEEFSTIDNTWTDAIHKWFGFPSPRNSDDEPERGKLSFGDFLDPLTDPSAATPDRCRIQIDETCGAAASGMLQVVESPWRPGAVVIFHGRIRCLVKTNEDLEEVAGRLRRGFLWPRGAGAARTSGFGRIHNATVDLHTDLLETKTGQADDNSWTLRLAFDKPLIFSKHRIAENLFESGEILPGGAIKGAIAGMIAAGAGMFDDLKKELHLLRFTHAFPADKGSPRPLQWPLSVQISNGVFEPDWKREEAKKIREKYHWPEVDTELRVRAATDSEFGNAEDSALFAWKMLRPYRVADGTVRLLEWVSQAEVSRLSPAARNQLRSLLEFGVEPLGKTKALASVQVTPWAPKVDAAAQYQVTLQSHALLIPPPRLPGTDENDGGAARLRKELESIWSTLSGGSLKLIDYFHRCSLAGGEYHQRRFGSKTRGTDRRYKPWLLSNPGSVFMLQPVAGREADARQFLADWQREGLPLSHEIRDFYRIPDDPNYQWQCCPYVPENGYGEITVNQPLPEATNVQE